MNYCNLRTQIQGLPVWSCSKHKFANPNIMDNNHHIKINIDPIMSPYNAGQKKRNSELRIFRAPPDSFCPN